MKYEVGMKVELEIVRETDLGFVALINSDVEGLLYHEEIFELLEPKQVVPGYIKKIRDDGAIDLMLQNIGNLSTEELAQTILAELKESGGYLPINSKSPASEVHYHFLVSRNKFKMALGYLYKKRLIEFTDEGTKLVV